MNKDGSQEDGIPGRESHLIEMKSLCWATQWAVAVAKKRKQGNGEMLATVIAGESIENQIGRIKTNHKKGDY